MFFQFVKHNWSSTRREDNSFIEIVGNSTLEQTFRKFYYVTTTGLIPFVSVLGIIGNILSMRILSKHGLHKCSTVLIFALALADTTYLVGINNVPLIIFEADLVNRGLYASESVARAVYVLFQIFVCLETVGKVVSLLLPTLIIFERLVAVYWPLHFSQVLTVRRVRLAAALMYPVGIPPYVYFWPLPEFHYLTDPATNVSFGVMLRSETFNADVEAFNAVSDIYTTICGPVSVGIVVVGCVLVGVKVHLQLRHRMKMMTSTQQLSRCPCFDQSRSACFRLCLKADDARICTVGGWRLSPGSGIMSSCFTQVDSIPSNSGHDVNLTTWASSGPAQETVPSSSSQQESMISSNAQHDTMTPYEFQANEHRQNVSKTKTQVNIAKPETTFNQPNGLLKTPRRDTKKGLRTTKILLSVCVVYSLTAGLSFLTDMVFSMRNLGYFRGVMLHRSGILAMCVNSTANFVIYVIYNRNFRETYKQMFCRRAPFTTCR